MKIQHNESAVKVYFTRDYGLFKTMEGNRQLNEGKIRRIKNDIDNGLDVLKYCPVICHEKDGRLEIIDGQHRFYVAKQMNSNVWYILAQQMSLQEIAKMNSNTEKWKPDDFINCYAVQGNSHYITLQEYKDKTALPLSVCMRLLTVGLNILDTGVGRDKERFQGGQFEVKTLDEANKVADIIDEFMPFGQRRSRPFVTAVCKIMAAGLVDVADVVAAFKKRPEDLKPQEGWKGYISNLEQIVNAGKHKRVVIWQ